eukprot:CAMPEP_0201554816 /NCGR_PEP_ID=MMETSP0173_2-20130828/44348_1 /ASSEMBLY_ACC=CAM_ASM_000268 /TAXON_ID=218659 /ORGANISM="Vexillifera sp., Strain DIVA3 564/2" /LENGTH=317 /DNA_ID=CAMNT_0047966299 /DNA_START=94 /DNA_END=1043 /DNA_ORIENTATION=-
MMAKPSSSSSSHKNESSLGSARRKRVLQTFSVQLSMFAESIEHLYTSSLPLRIPFRTTLFSYPLSKPFQTFLAHAITSHLQTNCSTVVIGSDSVRVNQMVDTLSIFLNAREKSRSSHVVLGRNYVPDLVLQGVVAERIHERELIKCMLPTTLINVDLHTVEQTPSLHEYCNLRAEYLDLEDEYFAVASSRKLESLWNVPDGLLRTFKAAAPIIVDLLCCLEVLPCSLREGFVFQSKQSMIHKAFILIKYVEYELMFVNTTDDNSTVLDITIIKRIRNELALDSDHDFTLILTIAEKYVPGIYVALAGNPRDIEEKFV